jgi:arginase
MLRLISLPYHLGRREVGVGAGPARFLAAGARQVLTELGHRVEPAEVLLPEPAEHEVAGYFAVQRALAERVREAVADGEFPFVLGGNCGSVLGVMAGVGLGGKAGVVWFDAHADTNTPETTTSGFLDGMPVAVLTGRCWGAMAARIPGFAALPDSQVLLAGVRSIDEYERELLDSSRITRVEPAGLGSEAAFGAAVSALAGRVESVHIHIDLDVIDLSEGRANELAVAGGPSLDALDGALHGIGQRCRINSVSLTCYNPAEDRDGRALQAGMRLLRGLGALVPA